MWTNSPIGRRAGRAAPWPGAVAAALAVVEVDGGP
jgi:hypothetical protein